MKPVSVIEPLEARVAPAIVLHFTDIDGDAVTLNISKGTPADLGSHIVFNQAGSQHYIQAIDLAGTASPQVFEGANITLSVVRGSNGDGFSYVGEIVATGIDLGAVTIHGDLGRIVCGDGVSGTQALKSLNVQSLGRFGTNTGASELESAIDGRLGSLVVKGNVQTAFVHVVDSGGGGHASIGSVKIGGSLVGGSVKNAGSIQANNDLGPVTIGQDIQGGSVQYTGFVSASGKLAGITLGGSLIGGNAVDTGEFYSRSAMGAVKIAGDVLGGSYPDTGEIDTGFAGLGSSIASVTIGGSLIGYGDYSGLIRGFNCAINIGPVIIGGSIRTIASGNHGGEIDTGSGGPAAGTLASVTIGGSLLGGSGSDSGRIYSLSNMGAVKIGGSVVGAGSGGTSDSGEIFSSGNMGFVSIGGDLVGGIRPRCGLIQSNGKLAGVTIHGSIIGGTGGDSGEIFGQTALGPVMVGGDVAGSMDGAALALSGVIGTSGIARSIRIGGSLIGGHPQRSGEIFGSAGIGAVTIGHDMAGGDTSLTGMIHSIGGKIGAVVIGGSTEVGGGASATITSAGGIGSLKVGGDLNGISVQTDGKIGSIAVNGSVGRDLFPTVLISAQGQLNPASHADSVAIGKITIGGTAMGLQIEAGYNRSGTPTNPDASISTVLVRGDWIASDLVAGVQDGGNGYFGGPIVLGEVSTDDLIIGTGGSAAIVARIASITIDGQVLGTPTVSSDSYAFAAEQIGAMKIGGAPVTLQHGPRNDLFDFIDPNLSDVTVEEL